MSLTICCLLRQRHSLHPAKALILAVQRCKSVVDTGNCYRVVGAALSTQLQAPVTSLVKH